MMFFLIGLVTALIGGFPFDIGRDGWWKKWLILTGSLTVANMFFVWLGTPQLIGPVWGVGATLLVAYGLLINAALAWAGCDHFYPHRSEYRPHISTAAVAAIGFLAAIGGLRGCGVVRSQDYRAFVADHIERRDWKADLQPIDTAHIRMVSEKQAGWMANKAFGQTEGSLGSQFKLGSLTIQKVKNELVWIAPLEFQGFSSWTAADVSPGYVIMSAEDPSQEARLVMGHKFRYIPSAYLGDNLERHLYVNGFVTRGTIDYTFEVDDEEHAFYVVTVYHPSIGYGGEVIDGIAIVNPESGEITEYSVEKAPAWVDRIIPSEFAHDRLTNFGQYGDGWVNTWWGHKNINKPTEKNLDLVWADDGRAYWFTGITSAEESDQSLIAFVLMDSRSGETREYALKGSDEKGVIEAVNASVSNFKGWEAADPILYNVYGELTWVVPVVSGGIFQQLALVRASTVQVTLGKSKNEALAKYRVALQSRGNTDAPTSDASIRKLEGKVTRFACAVLDGSTLCSLVLDDDSHIFTATPSLSPELVIAQIGDTVRLTFVETSEITVPLQTFDITSLHTSPRPERAPHLME